MGRKKRIKKLSLYGSVEGKREVVFLSFLLELYEPRKNGINFNFECSSGGTPDKIVGMALNEVHRHRCFAWLDEDFEPDTPLGKDFKERLAACWNIGESDKEEFFDTPLKELQQKYNTENTRRPTLIVSQPVCVESVILKVIGETLPFDSYEYGQRDSQIETLKAQLDSLINGQEPTEFYKSRITKELLEQKREHIPELDLLISMITKD